MKYIFLLSFLISLSSCEQAGLEQKITATELQAKLAQIQAFIASENCTENSSCNYMAYGSKACGGPSGYLLFPAGLDTDKLKEMAEEYTRAEALYNKQNGIFSDCSLETPPQNIACIDGNCVAVE